MPDEQIVQLLRDLRTGQQEHLALYRELAQRSIDAQKTALDLQRRTARLYRFVVSVAAAAFAASIYYTFRS